MTDLQNKYWTLQEQIRANRAQEGLKQFANLTDLMQTESNVALNDAKVSEIQAAIEKTAAEISKINSDTKLNKTKKAEMISSAVKNYASSVAELLKGFFGKNGVIGAIGSLAGSAGTGGFTTLLA